MSKFLGVIAMFEDKEVLKLRAVALFANQRLVEGWVNSYVQKHPDHALFPADVELDPTTFNPSAAGSKVLFTLCAEWKEMQEDDDGNELLCDYQIPVGSFTDKKVAKSFEQDFKKRFPDFPLKERSIPIDPTKA